jgi:hypothetical protein
MFGVEIIPGRWDGANAGEARDRYHELVIAKHAGAGEYEMEAFVQRLECQVQERQLLLAAIGKWKLGQGDRVRGIVQAVV